VVSRGHQAREQIVFLTREGVRNGAREHLLSYEAGYRTLLSPTFHLTSQCFTTITIIS